MRHFFRKGVLAVALMAVGAPQARADAVLNGVRLDPERLVRPALLEGALQSWREHENELRRSDDMVIVDYGRHSSDARLYVIDLTSGRVRAFHAAHGRGSDADHDGWLDSYSNLRGSQASSRGAYRGAERYQGKHGDSLRLDGLDPANSNARDRAIVVHSEPRYVSAAFLAQHGRLGRSNGCIVVYREDLESVMSALERGAFLFVDGRRGE